MTNDAGLQKSVLVTGATDGLGRATALLLAQRGYRVFAAGRSAEKRAQLDALAHEKKLPMETLELDVCDDASVQRAVASVLAKAGRIDVLGRDLERAVAAAETLREDCAKARFLYDDLTSTPYTADPGLLAATYPLHPLTIAVLMSNTVGLAERHQGAV